MPRPRRLLRQGLLSSLCPVSLFHPDELSCSTCRSDSFHPRFSFAAWEVVADLDAGVVDVPVGRYLGTAGPRPARVGVDVLPLFTRCCSFFFG